MVDLVYLEQPMEMNFNVMKIIVNDDQIIDHAYIQNRL